MHLMPNQLSTFVHAQNIKNFQRQIAGTTDPARLKQLRDLLKIEEDALRNEEDALEMSGQTAGLRSTDRDKPPL